MNPSAIGPYTIEALDDTDPVKSSKYGLKNVKRIVQLLSRADTEMDIDGYDLNELYGKTIEQRVKILRRVIDMIGGATIQHTTPMPAGAVYTPIPFEQQRTAMKYLDTAAFSTPLWLVDANIPRTMDSINSIQKIETEQVNLLKHLLSRERLERILKQETADTKGMVPYTLKQVLQEIQKTIWKEIYQKTPFIDNYRQALQTTYLTQMSEIIHPPNDMLNANQQPVAVKIIELLESCLGDVRAKLMRARSADKYTKQHIYNCILSIDKMKTSPKAKGKLSGLGYK